MALRSFLGNVVDKFGTGLNLPEFGLSERLAGGRTTYTGSSPQARATEVQQQAYPSPYPIGPSMFARTGQVNSAQANTPYSGGGGGGSQGSNTFANFNANQYAEPIPGQPEIDWDAIVAPAISALSDAENAAQSSYGADVAGIDQQLAAAKGRQQQFVSGEEAQAGQERVKKEQAGESAVNESRRQFSEIQQGLQSLYGGTTGTGQFAGEIAGRETLRNIGQTRTAVSNALSEIDNRLGQVRQVAQLAIEDAENQAGTLKQQAKASLDAALAQIRSTRGQIESRKAEMAMSALQNYQSLVADIGARNAAFKQNIAVRSAEIEQQLADARTRAANIANKYVTDPIAYLRQQTPVEGFKETYSFDVPQIGGRGTFVRGGTAEDEEASIFDVEGV